MKVGSFPLTLNCIVNLLCLLNRSKQVQSSRWAELLERSERARKEVIILLLSLRASHSSPP
uniref:Uncharacterized protein n=1 Tax=Utricularia reniformis TaxID=192314 RepID=A0A1Y0B4W7_9LAMI|nr:hypothetical protein AEK19_MT2244 [Utricularia reniformis]ART32389.1 hypothetical protein AEK19_MT2244 [Utricularia reniformis]